MKLVTLQTFTVLSILLCPLVGIGSESLPGSTARAASDYDRLEAPLLRTKQVTTPAIRLTQRYPSMQGPKSIKSFQLETEPDNTRVWIRRYKIDVLDAMAGFESTEFLCHAWLMADSGLRPAESAHRGARGGRDPSLFLTISQGFEDMHFRDGFAVEFDTSDVSRVGLLTMAVNNNHDEIDKEIQFRATIDYLDDPDAQKLGIKPLTGFQLHAHQTAREARLVQHHTGGSQHAGHASSDPSSSQGAAATRDHWLVPPGRQVVRSEVKAGVIQFDGMIHFIKIHLHPYGESLALIDTATGEEVWKGYANNHPEQAHLLSVDSYSDTSGIPIHSDRVYELITVYDNPTDQPIDAMAVMRLYVHPAISPPPS